jgi:Ca2+-binding RTX toxin-like protein
MTTPPLQRLGDARPNRLKGSRRRDFLQGLAGNDWLWGGEQNDILSGGAGQDWLDGGDGADLMVGDSGNDVYSLDSRQDQISEQSGQGRDRVRSTISLALIQDIEELELLGVQPLTGVGNSGSNLLIGNQASNSLVGLAGNDRLMGMSGDDRLVGDGKGNQPFAGKVGKDRMLGGAGDDTYYVNHVADRVIELADQGRDTVISNLSTYTLPKQVESLILFEKSGNSAAVGNALDNEILGNQGDNHLEGLDGDDTLDGGAGQDQLVGGLGNDRYFVDDPADRVFELSDQGVDSVISRAASYSLSDQVEQLYLADNAGDISGNGNGLDNSLFGNDGQNVLDGQVGNDTLDGGAGRDRLIGGLGDDRYLVDNPQDEIFELSDQGLDLVLSQTSYTLPDQVEQLFLQGDTPLAGTGNALNNLLSGNESDNILMGEAGNDRLIGRGGNDTLTGGAGEDLFFYAMPDDQPFAAQAFGVDTITDFRSDRNLIVLSKRTFGLSSNVSAQGTIGFSVFSEFASVADDQAAALSSARIVFSRDSSKLFYNPNQSEAGFGATGAGGAFAQFQDVTTLIFFDFAIVD